MEIIRQFGRLFGHKNRQFETLTEINAAGHKIRIWRAAKTLDAAKAFDHAQMKAQMLSVVSSLPRDKWEAMLMCLPSVACVAIVDDAGNGASCYPDWF